MNLVEFDLKMVIFLLKSGVLVEDNDKNNVLLDDNWKKNKVVVERVQSCADNIVLYIRLQFRSFQ